MEEERRLVPRRLLSFDASQMSFTRLGKVLYSGSHQGRPSSGRKPEPVSNVCASTSYRNHTRAPYLCVAGQPDSHLAAAVTKDNIEILGVDPTSITSLRVTKIGQKYLPTAAQWQGKHYWGHFHSGYVDSEQPSHGEAQASSGSNTDALKLAVADSGGIFRVYELNPNSGSLSLLHTSISSGRAINSISYSAVQPNTLVTAVSDGSVRLWDLRQGTRRAVAIFQRPGDIAREVQFQPENEHKFACIHDSGVVQRWDIRQRQSADFRIIAHQQGLSLDWHPHLNYLATGGRDHLVQLWNMNASSAGDLPSGASSPDMVISTPNSVSKVKWATGANDAISKASIVTSGRPIDSNSTKGMYSFWSLERPWIPRYTIEAHSDAVTDLCVANPTLIWSVGRDGKFAQTDLRYEPRVSKNLPPVVVDWPPWDIAAVSFPGGTTGDPMAWSSHISQGRNHTPAAGSVHETLQRKPSFAPIPQTGLHANISRTMSMANLSTSPSSLAQQLLSTSSNSASSGMGPTHNQHSGPSFGSVNSTSGHTPRSITPGTPTGSNSGTYFQSFGETNQQFVIEVGLPFTSDKTQQGVSFNLLYTREQGQSHAEVCEHNANVMVKFCLFPLAEVWKMLAVAVDAAESSFLRSLSDRDEQELAERWFTGYPVGATTLTSDDIATVAHEIGDVGAVSEEADTASLEDLEWGSGVNWEVASSLPRSTTTNLSMDESDASPSKWGTLAQNQARKRSGHGSETTGPRPQKALPPRNNPFHALRDKYRETINRNKMPWDFLPLLRDLLWRTIEMGSYISAVSLLLVFRDYSYALTDFKIAEIVEAGLIALNGTRSFVAAACIRNVMCDDPDLLESGIDLTALLEDTVSTPDTVCHRCERSLSDNIAFYARNNAAVGFWYCSRCHQMLDGCSYCNEPVKHLAVVMLACGHRAHLHCWEYWTETEHMNECPAGCGEIICSIRAATESKSKTQHQLSSG